MKLRKLTAMALTAALSLSLAVPAGAEGSADARLNRITQRVKTTLALSDEYTEFYGEPNETPLGTRWELNWNAEGKSLNVSATEEGKVLSMSAWDSAPSEDRGSFAPSFPDMTRDQAQALARDFLDRVLTDGEEAVFQGEDVGWSNSLNADAYSFHGDIDLNGLPSPLDFYVRVRVNDGAVVSFWRDDVSEYAGSLPAPETSITDARAAELLKDVLSLRLEYVRDGEDGPAVLRYLPESHNDFYVDAAAGELVDLTQLREDLARGEGGDKLLMNTSASGAAAAEDAAPEASPVPLTQAELEGVAKLEDVLDQAALSAAVSQWKELSLKGFELAGCSYSVDRETGEVSARLSYAKRDDLGSSRRTVETDAKTGALRSMSGYDPYVEDAPVKVDLEKAQGQAEKFLRSLWPEQFGKTELYRSSEAENGSRAHSFTFAQKVNGYFFPANSISVRVSAQDGSIMGFSKDFDDDVTFDSADGLIPEAEALDTWAATFPVELAYIAVPVELDLMGPEVRPLMDAGYSFYNALKPGYELGEQDAWYTGVDAKTGELTSGESYESPAMTYDDLDGHWAQAALTELASFNVGWFGGKAHPDQALTQLDLVALLASADGYALDLSQEGAADDLYDYAVRRGFLAREEREDGKALTRGQTVKLLLDSLGYGKIAQLPGIFRCDFADAADIPAQELGYAALAQGLGLVDGDEGLNYASGRAASRAEAAVLLWRLMKR